MKKSVKRVRKAKPRSVSSKSVKKGKSKAEPKKKASKQDSFKKLYKNKLFWIVVLVLVVLAILIGYFFSGNEKIVQDKEDDLIKVISFPTITPTELVEDKDKYANQKVLIKNAFIPSVAFIYATKTDGTKERLFISPQQKTYCKYFDLEGTLNEDSETVREWVFVVDNFKCVQDN